MFGDINRDIPVPLYYQISQLIRQKIEIGELKPGQLIPTEKEMQQGFDVSRATIRRAISELVYAGLLERRSTKGTIVAKTKIEETLYGFGSFTRETLKRDMVPQSRVLDFAIIPAPETVAKQLQIDPTEKVAALERLRIVDGNPVAVENWYTPFKFVPGIDRSYFKEEGREQSTYYMLQQRFGIQLFKAVDTIDAVALEARDARLLCMETGMPALLRARVSYALDNIPRVYSSGVYIIKLIVSLESGKTPFKS